MDGQMKQCNAGRRVSGWIVRVAVIIVALGGVAAIAAIGLSRGLSNNGIGSGPSMVDQFEARVTSFDLIIPASGELESKDKIEIRNLVEGRTTIKWVIDEGTSVKKGDLLVELVSQDLVNRINDVQLRVDQQDTRYGSAKSDLDIQVLQNESTHKKAEVDLRLAELELEKWLSGDDVTRVKDLELAIKKAERNQKRYTDDYQESIELNDLGFISDSQKLDDEIRMIEADAELEKATLALDTYNKYTRTKELTTRETAVQQAKEELARVVIQNETQLNAKQKSVESEQSQLTQLRDDLERWKGQLGGCTVYAPSDGLVVYGTTGNSSRPWRMEDPLMIGREVYSNQLLITLPDIVRMKAAVKVHESQSNQVKPGMPARIKVDAMPDLSLMGRVLSVGVMAQQSFGSQVREYSVDIEIEPDNTWDLKPSMRCKADILLGRVDDVLAIPLTGVFADRGRHYVWKRVSHGRYEKTYVAIGRASETMIELQDGIKEKDVVLLREPEPGEIVGGQDEQQPDAAGPDSQLIPGDMPPWPQQGGGGFGGGAGNQEPGSGMQRMRPGGGGGGGQGPGSGMQRMRQPGNGNTGGQQPPQQQQQGERGNRPDHGDGSAAPASPPADHAPGGDDSTKKEPSPTQEHATPPPAKPAEEG